MSFLRLSWILQTLRVAAILFVALFPSCSPVRQGVASGGKEQVGHRSRPADVPVATTSPPDLSKLRKLRGLKLTGNKIKTLEGLPESLRELDVSSTGIESLRFVPRGLKSLDMRYAQLRRVTELPPRLEVLKISHSNIRDLKPLRRLRELHLELHLEEVEVGDFSELPRDLKELHLTGSSFVNLNGLPPSLRALTLHSTRVKSLTGLQRFSELTQLRLINNSTRFETSDLPERLTELKLDRSIGPSDLSTLKHLSWLSDLRESPSKKLPASLSCITLNIKHILKPVDLPRLPPSLLALGLRGARFNPVQDLLPGLERLSLTNYSGPELDKLPESLKRLYLNKASLSKLPNLPKLEELHLWTTEIEDLKGVPADLKTLVFCELQTQKQLELVKGIGARFPKLQQLELCNSASLKVLGPLPKTLRKLNLSQTSIRQLPKLADDFEELNISKTEIRLSSLRELPRKLKVLTLSESQVTKWEDFPRHLEVLHLVAMADKGLGDRP